MDGSDNGQDDEPHPKKQENFLIDDVHAKNTKSIKVLDRSRASKFVEFTFGHPWKNPRKNKNY